MGSKQTLSEIPAYEVWQEVFEQRTLLFIGQRIEQKDINVSVIENHLSSVLTNRIRRFDTFFEPKGKWTY